MGYLGKQLNTASYPVDTFSGNNSQTVFSLSHAPGSDRAALVTIDGTVQHDNAYTIAGNTLTFSAAPPTGTNNIEVVHLGVRVEIHQPAASTVGLTELKTEAINALSPNGYLYGLTLSNNVTDAAHDIDVSTGICIDSTNTVLMELLSSITKQIDATWVAGTNQGGLFSGTVAADTWYHFFLIRKNSDGSIDAGFDTSITATNIPTGYTAYRRIGSVLTDGSNNIIGFVQFGDVFVWNDPISSYDGAPPTSPTNYVFTCPSDVRTLVLVGWEIYDPSSELNLYVTISCPDVTGTASSSTMTAANSMWSNAGGCGGMATVLSNTSSQLQIDSTSSNCTLRANTQSYIDTRGRMG